MDNGAPAPLYSWPLTSRKRRRGSSPSQNSRHAGKGHDFDFPGKLETFHRFRQSGLAPLPSTRWPAGRVDPSAAVEYEPMPSPPALPLGLAGERKKRARALWTWILKKTSCVRVTNASEKSGCRQTRHEGRRVKRKDRLALQHPSVHEMGAAASFRHPPLLA